MDKLRYETTDACVGCKRCGDKPDICVPARGKLRSYGGIRFTSDGMDCALPISIDSHSVCSYGCLYCFSDNLMQHRGARAAPIGQTSLRRIEAIFDGHGGTEGETIRRALHYDRRNSAGYPTPIQLGAICDPCDNIERQQGWLIEFIRLAIKYRQPIRMSTKGNVLLMPDYRRELEKAPELFWVAFSIISPDDELLEKIDRNAPNATMRLKTMKELSRIGVSTSLRFRPMMPGLSDSTPRHPRAYAELIARSAEAGARAVSYEVMFVPGGPTVDTLKRWEILTQVTGVDFFRLYRSFGKNQSCIRAPYTWTENIMHAVREEAHKYGMVAGVSDPLWKQLTDTGCCCGIMPDDPVFGNWQVESATNQLLLSKETGKEIGPEDITPEWAHDVPMVNMCNMGVGPLVTYARRHRTWADYLQAKWNDVKSERGPLNYFQGALLPTRVTPDGQVFYKYKGLERQNKPSKVWNVATE